MRERDDSPEVQALDPATDVDPTRPASVSGGTEINIFKPLGKQNLLLTFLLGYQSSWSGRFLAAGIGALAMMAAVLVTAIVIGISDPVPGLDIAMNESTDIERNEPIGFDIFSPPILPAPAPPLEPVRASVRSKPARPEVRLATSKRESRSVSRLRVHKFVPTTLVIYAENGVIKRRIEPWL